MRQTKEIYNRLEDEISKKIFESRLLHFLTGDRCFIGDMAFFMFPKFKTFLGKHNKIIIYGAGAWGTMACLYFLDNVVALCDSDKAKHNTYFLNRKIISPVELAEKYSSSNIGIVICIENTASRFEIKKNLIESGFSENQISSLRKKARNFNEQYFDNDVIPTPPPPI
jgi:hypothetical protein